VNPASPQQRPAAARVAAAGRALPRLETALEAVVGNRLGAGVYRRWVASLGLAGDERVLEVGTGAGACARHLAAALPTGQLTCLEIDPRWLAIARTRLAAWTTRVEFVDGDVTAWSRAGAFDAAVAHFVLHDLTAVERAAALRRIAESLRPGGTLHLREPITHGMTAEELRRQLSDSGFEQTGSDVRETVPLMGDTVSAAWRR